MLTPPRDPDPDTDPRSTKPTTDQIGALRFSCRLETVLVRYNRTPELGPQNAHVGPLHGPGDAQHPHTLHDAVTGLGCAGRVPGHHGSGRGLCIDRVRIPMGPAHLSTRLLRFEGGMPGLLQNPERSEPVPSTPISGTEPDPMIDGSSPCSPSGVVRNERLLGSPPVESAPHGRARPCACHPGVDDWCSFIHQGPPLRSLSGCHLVRAFGRGSHDAIGKTPVKPRHQSLMTLSESGTGQTQDIANESVKIRLKSTKALALTDSHHGCRVEGGAPQTI